MADYITGRPTRSGVIGTGVYAVLAVVVALALYALYGGGIGAADPQPAGLAEDARTDG